MVYDISASNRNMETGPPLVDKPLGQLMGDVVSEMGTLVRQEIALARVETKEELVKAGRAGGMFGAAALAGHMALLFFSLGLAWVLSQALTEQQRLPSWAFSMRLEQASWQSPPKSR
jgi:hypothetical protein